MRRFTLITGCLLALATAAFAQAPLTAPEGSTVARRVLGGRLLDCAEHGVWTPPEGWTATSSGSAVLALAPDGSAALARVRARPRLRADETFVVQATAALASLVGETPTFGAVVAVDHGRWRRERTVEGTAVRGGMTLHVWAHATRTEALWVGVHRDGDAAARAAIDAAALSWQMLVDHACLCGFDCDHR